MENDRLIYKDSWYYYKGRKYFYKDIDMLADMRRKGFQDGTLEGKELIDFVKQCLETTDYQVLGMEVSEDEIPDVFNCPNCNEIMTYREIEGEDEESSPTFFNQYHCPKCKKVVNYWDDEFEYPKNI